MQVLFELASGLRAYSEHRKPENLVEFMRHNKSEHGSISIQMADSKAGSEVNEPFFATLIDLGFCASSYEPNNRPSMKEILDYFENLKSDHS